VIRMALGAVHHAFCLFVADYFLFCLVPLELSAEDVGEVAEIAEVGHADGGFDIHNSFGACLDSVEPIFLVAGTLVNIFCTGGQFPLACLFLDPGAAIAAPVDKCSFIAMVNGAVAGATDLSARFVSGSFFGGYGVARMLIPGKDPIRILEGVGHVHSNGAIPKAFGRRRACRLYGNRASAIGAHPPHRTAHHVCASVADLSAAGFHNPAEGAVTVSFVVRSPSQRSEPQIPVKLCRRVTIGNRLFIDGAVVVETGDLVDAADIAVDEVAMGKIGLRLAASLRTDLYGDLVVFGGGYHRLSFRDGAAGGLLDVDVLAALGGVDHLDGVPVVGRGNDDGVDIFALEDITVISIGVDAGAGGLHCLGEALLINVADSGYVDGAAVLESFHIAQMEPAHSADAYVGHREPLARAGFAGCSQHA